MASLIVQEPHFVKIGVTDSGIFQLARSGILVLTDDAGLSGKLEKNDHDVLNFNHLRFLDW
jgi:hypothetical protein